MLKGPRTPGKVKESLMCCHLLCRAQIHGNYIIFKERGKGYFESDNNDLLKISIRFRNKGDEWSIENDASRKISAES